MDVRAVRLAIAVILAILSQPAHSAETSVSQVFQFLCEWSRNAMPVAFDSRGCGDGALAESASREQLTTEMESYWAEWTSLSGSTAVARRAFEESFTQRYSSPPPLPTEAELPHMPIGTVCSYWRARQTPAAFSELQRRSVFSDADLARIRNFVIGKGMTEEALHCSKGVPLTAQRRGSSEKQIEHRYPDDLIVLTEDGKVTDSWSQDPEHVSVVN